MPERVPELACLRPECEGVIFVDSFQRVRCTSCGRAPVGEAVDA